MNGAGKSRQVWRLGEVISISKDIVIYISYCFIQVLMLRIKAWKRKKLRQAPLRKSTSPLRRRWPLRNQLISDKLPAVIDIDFISPTSSSNCHHLNINQHPEMHESMQINEPCSADLSPLSRESLDADICSDDDGSVFMMSEGSSSDESDEDNDEDSVGSSEVAAEEVMIPLYKAELRSIPSFMAHLSSKLANRSIKGGLAVTTRTATFLSWYSNHLNEKLVVNKVWPVYELLYRFIKREYSLLIGFFDFLVQHRDLRGSSIVNYNNDLVITIQWFVWFRGVDSDAFSVSPIELTPTNIVFEKMRAFYSKQRRIEESASFEDIDDLIISGKWPENGYSDLNLAVMEEVDNWQCLLRDDGFQITRKLYTSFMKLLCGSFYGTAIQGRINGIRNLTMKQVKLLLRDDFALSKDFKTVKTFGFQPISSSPVCKLLLKYLLLYIRPTHFDSSDDAYLFVSWGGKRLDVGKFVSIFFKSKLGLTLNTTRIRAIVETSAEDLHLKGSISSSDRASVLAVNGHSEKIMKRHYLKRSRIQDALNVKSVMKKMVPTSLMLDDVSKFSDEELQHEYDTIADYDDDDYCTRNAAIVADDNEAVGGSGVCSIADGDGNVLEYCRPKKRKVDKMIGSLHPDITKSTQRIPWSSFEKQYVG